MLAGCPDGVHRVCLTCPSARRFMLYFFGKAFMAMCGCCLKDDDDPANSLLGEVTYEAALLARHAQTAAKGGSNGGTTPGTRASSVCVTPGVALAGAPTYRLPHHPRY